jgi:hypothetical protein
VTPSDRGPQLRLAVLPGRLAVARLAASDPVPEWAAAESGLSSVVRTADELSVLTTEGAVPAGARAERGYRALKVDGPLPFELTGILASIASPLARAGLSIFALSTYDTDYVLVKETDLAAAVLALQGAGHEVVTEGPGPRVR